MKHFTGSLVPLMLLLASASLFLAPADAQTNTPPAEIKNTADDATTLIALPAEAGKKKHKKAKTAQTVQTVENIDPVLAGKKVMEGKCSVCHAVPKPQMHTLSEWPSVLNVMGQKAFLRPDERKLIELYLQDSLKPKAKAEAK